MSLLAVQEGDESLRKASFLGRKKGSLLLASREMIWENSSAVLPLLGDWAMLLNFSETQFLQLWKWVGLDYLICNIPFNSDNLWSTEHQILICPSQWLSSSSLTHPKKAQEKKVTSSVTGQMLECLLGFHDLCSHYGDHAQLQLRFVAGRICTSLSKPGAVAAASYFLSLRQTTILFCFVFSACFEFAASQLLLLEQT